MKTTILTISVFVIIAAVIFGMNFIGDGEDWGISLSDKKAALECRDNFLHVKMQVV